MFEDTPVFEQRLAELQTQVDRLTVAMQSMRDGRLQFPPAEDQLVRLAAACTGLLDQWASLSEQHLQAVEAFEHRASAQIDAAARLHEELADRYLIAQRMIAQEWAATRRAVLALSVSGYHGEERAEPALSPTHHTFDDAPADSEEALFQQFVPLISAAPVLESVSPRRELPAPPEHTPPLIAGQLEDGDASFDERVSSLHARLERLEQSLESPHGGNETNPPEEPTPVVGDLSVGHPEVHASPVESVLAARGTADDSDQTLLFPATLPAPMSVPLLASDAALCDHAAAALEFDVVSRLTRAATAPAPELDADGATSGPSLEQIAEAAPAAEVLTWIESGAFWQVAVFLCLHAGLGLLMRGNAMLSTAHAAATVGVGLWFAANKRLDRAAIVVAYIAGAEILWRMTGALVPWEFGKYGAVAVMIVGMVRTSIPRPPLLPLLFFALLLPSAAFTLQNEPFGLAEDQISMYLSGPLAIMIGAWFFSQLQTTGPGLRAQLLSALAPTLGVAAISAVGTYSTSDILFLNSSNFAASGGFGPNQVSAALSLGSLLALLLASERHSPKGTRLLMGCLVLALATQSAMTFSRGGLYMLLGGAAAAAVYAARDPGMRIRVAAIAAVLFMAGNYVILPYLDMYTEGGISDRFQNTSTTGRDRLIQADLDMWEANPLFGVGPGEGRFARAQAVFGADSRGGVSLVGSDRVAAAHTEFSRILAEHGTLGLVAMLLLAIAVVLNVRHAPDIHNKGVLAGLTVWAVLFTMSEAFRCFAPALALAIGFATLKSDEAAQRITRPGDVGGSRAGGLRPLMGRRPEFRTPTRAAESMARVEVQVRHATL